MTTTKPEPSGELARPAPTRPDLPGAMAAIAMSLGFSLDREEQLGVSSGHDFVRAVVEGSVQSLEGP